MKVLILSCNTGQGHNSAAKAVQERMTELGNECVIKDTLAYASKLYSKGICNSYTKIVMHTPKAFGAGYRFSKSITYSPGKIKSLAYASNMLCSKKLYDDIVSGGFEAVICTHVFAGQAITHVKHKHGLDLPTYVVSTDYSFCPFFDELDVDKYFIPMEHNVGEFIGRGIPRDKIIPTGIPVSGKFSREIDKDTAKAALEIKQGRKLCLIMSGSMGYGDIYELIDKMVEENIPDTDILVIAGNNHKLFEGVNEKYADNDSVSAIGFTDKVYLFMKACDVVITKPGGLSSTESMVCNVPLVLTKPIPGCETENFELLTNLGCAVSGKKTDYAAMEIEKLLTDDDYTESIIENQRRYIRKNSAEIICDIVLKGKNAENEFVS